jgi:hypothetical protein
MTAEALTFVFEKPSSFGLRGDPYLWEELKAGFSGVEIAGRKDFEAKLHGIFFNCTEWNPQRGSFYFVERYANGGMSSGRISGDFWLEKGFPMLLRKIDDWLAQPL